MTRPEGYSLAGPALVIVVLANIGAVHAQDAQDQETTSPDAVLEAAPAEAEPPASESSDTSQTPAEDLNTIPVTPEPDSQPEQAVLEEIVVTATKREQAIEDVPISMSVFSEHFIARHGITSLTDIAHYAPNVGLGEAGYVIRPRIRGFSNNFENPGFEPPVSVVIDEIPYTRVPYFQAAVYDVDRVEVLRGPQGTSFGKNTTAGLFSIVTKNPSSALDGTIDLQSGEMGRQRAEFGLGGPLLGDFVQFRIAGLSDEQDGFTQNTFAQTDPAATAEFRGRRREGGRAKLLFPDILDASLKVTYEHITLDSKGTGAEVFNYTEEMQDYVRQTDPNADFVPDNFINSIGGRDYRTTTIESYGGRWDRQFGDWSFTLVGARSQMDTYGQGDADFTPVTALDVVFLEHTPTTTLELRALTPRFDGLFGVETLFGLDIGQSELLLGIFQQRRKITPNVLELLVDDEGTLGLLGSEQGSRGSGPPIGGLFTNTSFADSGGSGKERAVTSFSEDSEALAGFGQLDWYLHEQWGLQLGARWNEEVKKGSWERVISENNAVLTAADFKPYTAEREISETQVQPKLSLNYKPFDFLSLFLSWGRGFKSGGFNAVAENATDEELMFKAERATQWAIDAKTYAGTMRFNLSLYHMTLEDFQVLTSERKGPPGNENLVNVTKVTNADEARAQGAEADLLWQPVSWWQTAAGIGYNDTEYINFPIGPCPPGRTNTDGDADARCNLSGRPFPFAPKWNGMLTSGLTLPFWRALELGLGLTVDYSSFQYVRENLDPRMAQDAYYRLKASIAIGNPTKGWTFRVTGENLTDEVVTVERSIAAPTSQGLLTFADQPRIVYGQLRWDF